MKPQDLNDIVTYIREHCESKEPFDVAVIGSRWTGGKSGLKGEEKVALFREQGATWWLESLYMSRNSVEKMRSEIQLGPPRVD